jgi:RNA polymerase sigma-70 factor (ECF subfamily)
MTAMEREYELSLVRRVRDGDTQAFDEIYDAFNPRLYNFLRRMSKRPDIAEDLLEETWLRLVSSAARFDVDTRLAPWLFTVARNLYLSYCRSRVREQSYTSDLVLIWPDQVASSPLQTAMSNEFENVVEAAVYTLPAKYREALLLVGVEDLRPGDAAAVCGISPEAFRQRLSRARALITRQLRDQGWLRETEEATV